MFAYYQQVLAHFEKLVTSQPEAIKMAAERVGRAIVEDRIIHTFGTGHSHMIGLEMFVRAGGLANVNAMLDSTVLTVEGSRRSAKIERVPGIAEIIWEEHQIHPEDLMIVISNSGRNAMPIEMAQKARDAGLFVIGITSMQQSQMYPSRHPSGRKLYELVDLVIDNHVPPGDGLMRIGGCLTGPASSISGMLLINLLVTEGLQYAADKGVRLPVYYSQNIDGYSNEELYALYENRIKHL